MQNVVKPAARDSAPLRSRLCFSTAQERWYTVPSLLYGRGSDSVGRARPTITVRAAIVAVVLGLGVLGVPLNVYGEPDPAADKEKRSPSTHTALNQSLALDESGDQADQGKINDVETNWKDGTELREAAGFNTAQSDSVTHTDPVRTEVGERRIQLKTSNDKESPLITGSTSGNHSTPWYQKGPGALVIVSVLIGAAAFLLRRWAPAFRAAENGLLEVVGRTSLTPKHSLALVRLNRRFVLVGIGPDGVRVLSEISDAEEAAEMIIRGKAAGTIRSWDFAQALGREASTFEDDVDRNDRGSVTVTPRPIDRPRTGVAALIDRVRSLKSA